MSLITPIAIAFLIMAMVIIAPHLDRPFARFMSIVCVAFAVFFIIADAVIAK